MSPETSEHPIIVQYQQEFGEEWRSALMNNFPMHLAVPEKIKDKKRSYRDFFPSQLHDVPFGISNPDDNQLSDLMKSQTPREFWQLIDRKLIELGINEEVIQQQIAMTNLDTFEELEETNRQLYDKLTPLFISLLDMGYKVYPDLSR